MTMAIAMVLKPIVDDYTRTTLAPNVVRNGIAFLFSQNVSEIPDAPPPVRNHADPPQTSPNKSWKNT